MTSTVHSSLRSTAVKYLLDVHCIAGDVTV